MACVSEKNIAVENALARAQFEVINAIEAKVVNNPTRLWHIYKAQKALKEAAAILVEDKQAEVSNVSCDSLTNIELQRDSRIDRRFINLQTMCPECLTEFNIELSAIQLNFIKEE